MGLIKFFESSVLHLWFAFLSLLTDDNHDGDGHQNENCQRSNINNSERRKGGKDHPDDDQDQRSIMQRRGWPSYAVAEL